ncbi:hypothetical protein M758_10G045500 [Ceratodon purpureus]|nr:hypothetical protein M758_10G045500 [Ceratodon purpureus]
MVAKDEAKPTDEKPKQRQFVEIPEPSAMEFIYRPLSVRPPPKKKETGVYERLNQNLRHLKKKNRWDSIEHRHSKMKHQKMELKQKVEEWKKSKQSKESL